MAYYIEGLAEIYKHASDIGVVFEHESSMVDKLSPGTSIVLPVGRKAN